MPKQLISNLCDAELQLLPRSKAKALAAVRNPLLKNAQIASQMEGDPGLAAILIARANQLTNADLEIASPKHAVAVLGRHKLEELLSACHEMPKPLRSDSQEYRNLLAYKRNLVISVHAAHQASAWVAERNIPAGNLYWSTLIQQVGNWLLWQQRPDLGLAVETAIMHGNSVPKAEQTALQCRLALINREVARRWQLPKHTRASLEENFNRLHQIDTPLQIDNAQERLAFNSSSYLIHLANRLASYADRGWHNQHTRHYIQALAVWLRCPVDRAAALTHQICAETSRSKALENLQDVYSPAAKLLLNYEFTHDASASSPHGLTTFNNEHLPSELREQPSLQAAAQQFVNNLRYNLASQRVMIMQEHEGHLTTLSQAGYAPQRQHLQANSKTWQSEVWKTMCSRSTSFRVNPQTRSRIQRELPESLRPILQDNYGFITSITRNKSPLLLIYASTDARNIHPTHRFKTFRRLCETFGDEASHRTLSTKTTHNRLQEISS